MREWPDESGDILAEYIEQLPPSRKRQIYRCELRRFEKFVSARRTLNQTSLRAWLRAREAQTCTGTALVCAQWTDRYLEWLATRGLIEVNPFDELRRKYRLRLTAPIARAMLGSNLLETLESQRPLPRYGSHLGSAMREHVSRMRTLGFRYRHEYQFLQFDRYLQRRTGAHKESLPVLAREYAFLARSAAVKIQRLHVARLLAKALKRKGVQTELPAVDRGLLRERERQHCKPYIYSIDEVRRIFKAARTFPSPLARSRPHTLYTMMVLAYCTGLRVSEVVSLRLKDVSLVSGTIEIRETKFFKSRGLPISASVLRVLKQYMKMRRKAQAPQKGESALFWNERRPYSYISIVSLLAQVIRQAGVRTSKGRGGPRVHDLRHTFVVHRISEWHRKGLDPQPRLPYLSTYLGHRDINSTLVYITITQEMLQKASSRVRSANTDIMKEIQAL
jgi:integrase/recombinase XerD